MIHSDEVTVAAFKLRLPGWADTAGFPHSCYTNSAVTCCGFFLQSLCTLFLLFEMSTVFAASVNPWASANILIVVMHPKTAFTVGLGCNLSSYLKEHSLVFFS